MKAASVHSNRRRGFTFIEVMFSVMILGFGVIMVAVMIPVAIRQTQETRDTNAGNAVVESGFHNLETMWGAYGGPGQSQSRNGVLPSTNWLGVGTYVVTFPSYGWDDAWADGLPDTDSDGFSDRQENAAGTDPNLNTSFPRVDIGLMGETLGNRIESMSAQTAWIPFYVREGSLFPYISLVGVHVRNVLAFGQTHFSSLDNCPLPVQFEIDQRAPATGTSAKSEYEQDALAPAPDGVSVEHMEPTVIRIAPLASGPGALTPEQIQQAAVEGAVLVTVNARGQIRILTLSKPRTDISLDHWELAPGGGEIEAKRTTLAGAGLYVHEFETDPDGITNEEPVRAYLVGRMLKNPLPPEDANRNGVLDTGEDSNSNGVLDPATWDQNDNPYIGSTQVVQILEGKMLR